MELIRSPLLLAAHVRLKSSSFGLATIGSQMKRQVGCLSHDATAFLFVSVIVPLPQMTCGPGVFGAGDQMSPKQVNFHRWLSWVHTLIRQTTGAQVLRIQKCGSDASGLVTCGHLAITQRPACSCTAPTSRGRN